MLGVLVLSLMLIGDVTALYGYSWGEDTTEPQTEFFCRNLTCNDAGDVCGHCFTGRLYGMTYMNVFECSKDPAKMRFSALSANRDINLIINQDDPSDPFRFCDTVGVRLGRDVAETYRANFCVDNTFPGVALPQTCAKPIALVWIDARFGDGTIRSEKILYCLPE